MPLDDIVWAVQQTHRFCQDRGLKFGGYPMHEVAAHPQAADVLRFFAEHVGGAEFEPLSTTGVPLATRDDWREVLATAREIGTTTVWLAFHGLADVHDAVVARLGAFAETCMAVERSHAAGLRVGANVFVTKRNLPRISELAVALQDLRLDEMSWEPASFTPTPRGRQFEPQRPALQDLQPHVETILSCTNMSRDRWRALDDFTEAAHRQRALDGDWPTYDPSAKSEVGLVCRPDLDVYVGMPGVLRERLGNLRADGPDVVLERAIAHGPVSDDALWHRRFSAAARSSRSLR